MRPRAAPTTTSGRRRPARSSARAARISTRLDAQCITKRTFIVPGDSVTVYKSHGRWYDIMYVNGKTGDDVEGWVEQGRVRLGGQYGAQ